MACLCGNSYCVCKGMCTCDREVCKCASCHKLWKKVCKKCGRECLCLELPELTNYPSCHCLDEPFEGVDFRKLPDLDFLSNKVECSNVSGQSTGKTDSEAESETSLDKSTSQTDELLFQTDGTDSSPDKNLEIRSLAELYPDSPSLPSIKVSNHGESNSMNEYALCFQHSSSGRVRHHSQSSTTSQPMSIDTPPSHFPTEPIESTQSSNRTFSAPAVNAGYFSQSRASSNLPVRSLSTSPRIGLGSTVDDTSSLLRKDEISQARSANLTPSSSSAVPLSPEQLICKSLKMLPLSDSPAKIDESPERPFDDTSLLPEHKFSVSSAKETAEK